MSGDKLTVIDTAGGIEAYRMMVMRSRLKMEMAGIRFRISTFAAARRELGMTSRVPRAKVLAAYEAKMREAGAIK
jgi:hypothetical protein